MRRLRLPARRGVLVTLIMLGCILIIGLVIFSPVALTGLQNFNRNWSELSNIGQTYGAISALISSLALGGVIVSLLYQARDGRTGARRTHRKRANDTEFAA